MSSVSGGSRLNEAEGGFFARIWSYIKSTAYLQIYEGYTDDYVKIKMQAVKKFVKIEVDGKTKIDQAKEKYAEDKEKASDATKKIQEQIDRTAKAFNLNMLEEIKLLDATYERKYGKNLIEAHKASAAYLKANGKIIGDYKYDMAVINEKMKNAKILGLDEEWQKEQVGELKEKNAEKVAEMQDGKVKAEQAAAEAEEQKETVDALEKAVPGFAKLPAKMEQVNTAGGAIFFTKEEKYEASQERKKAADSVSKKYDLEEESYKLTEKDEEDDKKVKEESFVKDLSKLIFDKDLSAEVKMEATDEDKKARIKKGLETFKKGYEAYIKLKQEIDTIKRETADTLESMGEGERPKGSSAFINKWGSIEPGDHDEPTELAKEIDEKIKQCEDAETKPNDILNTASGSSKSKELNKLKDDIAQYQFQKETLEDKLRELKDEDEDEDEGPSEEGDDKEVKEVKAALDGLFNEKEKLQQALKDLQAA